MTKKKLSGKVIDISQYVSGKKDKKKDRNKWANKFRELGKKKGSRSDFVKLSKEMKKHKEENKKSVDPKKS